MATKEVTISNIKFNLSTKPLVSEPEIYPDYKYDMSTEELSNRLTQILQGIIINKEPRYYSRLCSKLYRRLRTRPRLCNLNHRHRRLRTYLGKILCLGQRKRRSYTRH